MTFTKFLNHIRSLTILAITGCSLTGGTVPDRYNWKASDFFDDATLIQLCDSVAAGDQDEVARFIATGVEVNKLGNDNMTPLMWAYFHDQLACFELLLKAGADPYIQVNSVLKTRGEIKPEDSVASLTAEETSGYFDLILAHSKVIFGQTDSFGHNILDNILRAGGSYIARIEKLIELGANLHQFNSKGRTPAMTAAILGKFDAVLTFLNNGYKESTFENEGVRKLIHFATRDGRAARSEPQVTWHRKVMQILVDRGESVEEARRDLERWESWGRFSAAKDQALRKKEVAERKEREAAEMGAENGG